MSGISGVPEAQLWGKELGLYVPDTFWSRLLVSRRHKPLLLHVNAERLPEPPIGRLSLTYKLPAICEWREMTEMGRLASYGYRLSEGYAMLAALTAKMLTGAPPGETPAQQPTRFELVINQKVARAIGIEIPPSILARADEVIE